MTPLAWVGLTILALPWLCTLVVVAFAVAVWWHRPRNVTQVTLGQPVNPVKERPVCNECKDCGHTQRPDWTVCWACSGTRFKLADPSVHLWV